MLRAWTERMVEWALDNSVLSETPSVFLTTPVLQRKENNPSSVKMQTLFSNRFLLPVIPAISASCLIHVHDFAATKVP